MLLNINRHEFGKKQVTEEDVDDVELPPWALGNALLFTHRYREVSLLCSCEIKMLIDPGCSGSRIRLRFPPPSRMD